MYRKKNSELGSIYKYSSKDISYVNILVIQFQIKIVYFQQIKKKKVRINIHFTTHKLSK